jgi:hypothetical protein
MNILFLDVDGVLSSKQHFLATKDAKTPPADTLSDADLFIMKRDTNKNNMWCLGYILEKVPDLKIVISSSWRLHYSIESFEELFKIYGLDGDRIIGKTPKKLSSTRANEIHFWLDDFVNDKENPMPRWVALDDHKIFELHSVEEANEVLTDSWVGLTLPDVFKVIKHFDPNFKEPIVLI